MPANNRHLDAEEVAAFCSGALNARERSHALEHLAGCEACREWIAVASGMDFPRRKFPKAAIALALAASLVCVAVTSWLMARHVQANHVVTERAGRNRFTTVRVRPHAERTVHLPATPEMLGWRNDALNQRLPLAWRQIRFAAISRRGPGADQFTLQTGVGEKWITLGALWDSGTGVR